MLAVQRNRKNVFDIVPISGRYGGRVVATAERVVLAQGDLSCCTLHSVWGLQPRIDISTDVTLLRDLSIFGHNHNRGA